MLQRTNSVLCMDQEYWMITRTTERKCLEMLLNWEGQC